MNMSDLALAGVVAAIDTAIDTGAAPRPDELNQWMFESSPDCVKLLALDGTLQAMNRNGRASMEIEDFEPLRGRAWASLWPEESRVRLDAALDSARRGGVGRFSAFCPTARGRPKWWDVLVTPVLDGTGRVGRLLCVSRDVTELYRSQQHQREAATRLRFMLDAAEIGDWELDLDTGRVRGSLRHARCFGHAEPMRDWTLETFFAHVHPADREAVRRGFEAALQARADWRSECRVVRADGSVHWIGFHGSIPGGESRPARMLGIISDITQRRREQALAEGQKKALELNAAGAPLREVLRVLACASEAGTGETLQASILLLDADGLHLRRGAAPSLPESLEAATDGIRIGPSVGSCGTAAFLKQPVLVSDIRSDPRWAEVKDLALPHGLLACWSLPIRSPDGTVLGTLASYCREARLPSASEREAMTLLVNTAASILQQRREARERRQAEEDLRRLAEELAEADRRKTEFLATLAHELRNPLAPIRTGLEILRLSGANPAAAARTREMMERQLSHMVHLVDDLLDVARITRGKLELRRERVDLRSAVSSAIETSLPLIEAGCHELAVQVPDEPLPLDADPIRIAQVVSNLLNNAAKYTPPGGRIALSARREGAELVLSVADNGVGLSAEALGTVFQMFTQVGQDAGRAQGGLGIGLTLVRQLVELHGGSVAVASPGLGQGCTFTIRLPMVRVEAGDEPAAAGRPGEGEGGAARQQGLRVLVVDDNADAAETLSALIGMLGHAVRVANDGPQALQLAREFRPDVGILDIGMPGMDGYELARELRRAEGLEPLLLVALTGWGGEEDRARSREAGFDRHMTKPADLAVLNRLLTAQAQARAVA